LPISTDEFFFKDSSLIHLRFLKDDNGQVTAVEIRAHHGVMELNQRINE
jgi:hypothetical protein